MRMIGRQHSFADNLLDIFNSERLRTQIGLVLAGRHLCLFHHSLVGNRHADDFAVHAAAEFTVHCRLVNFYFRDARLLELGD